MTDDAKRTTEQEAAYRAADEAQERAETIRKEISEHLICLPLLSQALFVADFLSKRWDDTNLCDPVLGVAARVAGNIADVIEKHPKAKAVRKFGNMEHYEPPRPRRIRKRRTVRKSSEPRL